MSTATHATAVEEMNLNFDRERIEDVGFMTCMTLVLLGNYAQTGHFGGPLAYTPYNVALHLAGPELGGLRYDVRRPKHPYCDKFMLAGGHNIPTGYALWMILYQALARRYQKTGDKKYFVDPHTAILPVDALGFRRGAGALKTLLKDAGLADNPLFAQAKTRGIRALQGHAESTDATNDVNGGPSGVGLAAAAGKAAFWDFVGAKGPKSPKIIALEGEFAMTEGHAQELKTQALALQVGKRLRVMLSQNNAGIDDALIGGVIAQRYADVYNIAEQWSSYGWNVFTVENGNDYGQVVSVLKTMEEWDADDRRPMIVIGNTIKGYWPSCKDGKLECYGEQVISYKSHPYGFKMNSEYFVALAQTFEQHYGMEFEGIRKGPVTDTKERLIQFKTNIDKVMSLLDKNGLGDWLADRLVTIGDTVKDDMPLRIDAKTNPFLDERLRVKNLPTEPQKVTVKNSISGKEKQIDIALFKKPGEAAGARRGISEIVKWMNFVTGNRFYTLAADLSESINVEHGALWGHYSPETNPLGTRVKAAIQEAGNVSTAIGLVSLIAIEVARPDFKVVDRNRFADQDLKASAKGCYVIRDFAAGKPKHGYVVAQGSSSTNNLVSILPRLDEAGINVKIVSAISEELFDRQPEAYRAAVLPPDAYFDLMFVTTGTRRMWPLRDTGPLTDRYSLTADQDNQWLSGGLETDVIAEAKLDAESIFKAIKRFADEREKRMTEQKRLIGG